MRYKIGQPSKHSIHSLRDTFLIDTVNKILPTLKQPFSKCLPFAHIGLLAESYAPMSYSAICKKIKRRSNKTHIVNTMLRASIEMACLLPFAKIPCGLIVCVFECNSPFPCLAKQSYDQIFIKFRPLNMHISI